MKIISLSVQALPPRKKAKGVGVGKKRKACLIGSEGMDRNEAINILIDSLRIELTTEKSSLQTQCTINDAVQVSRTQH